MHGRYSENKLSSGTKVICVVNYLSMLGDTLKDESRSDEFERFAEFIMKTVTFHYADLKAVIFHGGKQISDSQGNILPFSFIVRGLLLRDFQLLHERMGRKKWVSLFPVSVGSGIYREAEWMFSYQSEIFQGVETIIVIACDLDADLKLAEYRRLTDMNVSVIEFPSNASYVTWFQKLVFLNPLEYLAVYFPPLRGVIEQFLVLFRNVNFLVFNKRV